MANPTGVRWHFPPYHANDRVGKCHLFSYRNSAFDNYMGVVRELTNV